jgi:hypothetical protein
MDFTRPIASGVLVAAITAGVQFMTGRPVDYMVCATDGGIMAASVVAADVVHINRFIPPIVPPALVAGAVYSGGQRLIRNDQNYLMNGAIGAGADFLTDQLSG